MNTQIKNIILTAYKETKGNIIYLPESKYELTMYGEPIIGFGSAHDPLFNDFTSEEIIGDNFKKPEDWLPNAKSVISVFFPVSDRVRASNSNTPKYPSEEWLYARIEGQAFIENVTKEVCTKLNAMGINTCIPSCDSRFNIKFTMVNNDFHVNSAWSERHSAYVCGLGTFGLSRGLITEKGMAGRFSSIITDSDLLPTKRNYTSPYEYCIKCGECISNCPVNAISIENLKNNTMCNTWLDTVKDMCSPRYGCGKCQVGVPCEHEIPKSDKYTIA